MKYSFNTTLSIMGIILLVNWSSEEVTIAGKKKHKVNFYGTLTTWKGEEYQVDNIAIGSLYKNIPLYEPPATTTTRSRTASDESNLSEKYTLTENPVDGIITKIDLVKIAEIRTPTPDIIWTYKRAKGSSKHEYIKIEVLSVDNTKASYLVEVRKKVTCDLVNCANNTAKSEAEKEVPFSAVKRLLVEGHYDRDASEDTKPIRSPQCNRKSKSRE